MLVSLITHAIRTVPCIDQSHDIVFSSHSKPIVTFKKDVFNKSHSEWHEEKNLLSASNADERKENPKRHGNQVMILLENMEQQVMFAIRIFWRGIFFLSIVDENVNRKKGKLRKSIV